MSTPGFSVLAPLRVRDYRLQWPADLFTAWAFEMEVMLLGWFVLTTSNSVFLMSVIGAMPFIGTLLAPVVGMVGDRIGLRNLLCLMRAFYLVNAMTLMAFALTGNLTIPVALIIAAMTGLVRPSDIGVRTALVANTVSAGILPNAMGLSRTTFDTARIFGALSGAGLFAVFGLGMAYVLVVTCYSVGLILTLMISRPPRATPPSGAEVTRPSPLRDLIEGFGYVLRTPKVLAGMCLMAWNMYKTMQLAKAPAPQPVLPPDAAEARA